jgi:hypothetical protein
MANTPTWASLIERYDAEQQESLKNAETTDGETLTEWAEGYNAGLLHGLAIIRVEMNGEPVEQA